jgi:hypothetical protein
MFHPLNVVSSLTGVKEMSEEQNLINQINEARSKTSSDQRNTMIKIVVFLMAIIAFVMALQ